MTNRLEAWEARLGELASIEGLDETADALHHDVGKYVARVARNISKPTSAKETLSSTLLSMLIKDLYQTHQGRPASARFQELREALPPSLRDSEIMSEVASLLVHIDALEPRIRRGTPDSIREAASAALLVEQHLKGIAHATRRACEARHG